MKMRERHGTSSGGVDDGQGARETRQAASLPLSWVGARKKARHREPTAHARARYRCFLPDLAGLAGIRRVGPIPDPDDFTIEAPGSQRLKEAGQNARRPRGTNVPFPSERG